MENKRPRVRKITRGCPDISLPEYITTQQTQTGLALICETCKELKRFTDGIFARLRSDHTHPGFVAETHTRAFHQGVK